MRHLPLPNLQESTCLTIPTCPAIVRAQVTFSYNLTALEILTLSFQWRMNALPLGSSGLSLELEVPRGLH